MIIKLRKSIWLLGVPLVGEALVQDEKKTEQYKNIFGDAENEEQLREKLLGDGIEANAVNEFIKTLRGLFVILGNGDIANPILLREYGDYRIGLVYDEEKKSVPFHFLPVSLERGMKSGEPADEEPFPWSSSDFCALINRAQRDIWQDPPSFSLRRLSSPRQYYCEHRRMPLTIEVSPEEDKWELAVAGKRFYWPEVPRSDYHSFFADGELIQEKNGDAVRFYLRLPISKARDKSVYGDVVETFRTTFKRDVDDEWGHFEGTFENVDVLPVLDEAGEWYAELFNRTLKVNRYFSREDLKFKWDEIRRKYGVFRRAEYEKEIGDFDYQELIERYEPAQEEYWLLQAGADLDPYAAVGAMEQELPDGELPAKTVSSRRRNSAPAGIHIPRGKYESIGGVLERWGALSNATNITIVDNFANNVGSIATMNALFSGMKSPPQSVKIVSRKDEEPRDEPDREMVRGFEAKFHVKIETLENRALPHDRYWCIDGQWFTVGVSVNNIAVNWDERGTVRIKDQINVNPIDAADVPDEVRKWR